MRAFTYLALLLIACGYGLILLRGRPPGPASPTQPEVIGQSRTVLPPDAPHGSPWQAKGTTRPAPGRRGIIAPVPLHPVIEVKVKPGDRVKKGQVLVKLDDDEPQADVRAKKAAVEISRITLKEARRFLIAAEGIYRKGSLPETSLHVARTAAAKADQDEKAAVAMLASSQAELEHYTVTAPIDGIVTWLNVVPGMVSRPGTTVWGEILDLSEMDVQCDLTPSQAARVGAGERAVVCQGGVSEARWEGRVTFVGVAADPQDGRVLVWVRLTNPGERLRCHTEVVVTFGDKERPGGRDK